MQKVDESKRKRAGVKYDDKRKLTVAVRLNEEEMKTLDENRALVHMARGEYMRAAFADELPKSVPAVNQTLYLELARIGNNLNQIARKLNQQENMDVLAANILIKELRNALIDVRREVKNQDES